MNLENYVKMRALERADESSNSGFLDSLLAGQEGDGIREKILTKRLQFDTTPVLFAEVESLCQLLDCSKRQFLEMAVCHAIAQAKEVFSITYEEATGRPFGETLNDQE